MHRPENTPSTVSIVAVRILLLVVAAGSVVMGAVAGRTRGNRAALEKKEETRNYACPMHPEVASTIPADCPICGMALEARTGRQGPGVARAPETFRLPAGAAPPGYGEIGWARRYDSVQDMRVPAWVESADCVLALFYLDQAELLRRDEAAAFMPALRPSGVPMAVALRMQRRPAIRWDAKTALVSFRILGTTHLVPGQTGFVKLPARVRAGLVVLASAILQSPAGPYVLTVGPDAHTLQRRPVAIGSVVSKRAAILSGLGEGEQVVAARAFVFDAERRLNERSAQ